MSRFPLFGMHAKRGRSVKVSAQRRLNLFSKLEIDEGDRGRLSFHSTPGLVLFSDFGGSPVRGAITLGVLTYAVHRDGLYTLNNSGARVKIGTLNTTSGHVDMAHNGLEIVMVDGTNGYSFVVSGSTFAVISDGDFPDTATSVTYLKGRFIFSEKDSGQFAISASYDGTTYDATEVANAESFPDDLVRVFADHGQIILFGAASTEFWSNVGNIDFPYAPVPGAVVEWGLAARWSVGQSAKTVAFLAKNREGHVSVMQMEGYAPQRISNDDVEYLINKYTATSDAIGFTYRHSGHTFFQLNFPAAAKSWLFDFDTLAWSELEYGAVGGRHRAEFGAQLVEKTLCFDYEDGTVYKLDPESTSDNGVPITREIIGRHIFDEETLSIGRLWMDAETGQGNDPQAMLSISRDGGNTYGPERWTTLGAVGEYTTRAIWRTLGQAYDIVLKIRISGATKCTISGAWVDAS